MDVASERSNHLIRALRYATPSLAICATLAATLATSCAAAPLSHGSKARSKTVAPANRSLSGARFYVEPGTTAARTASDWASSDPTGAALMQTIAAQPQARWFDGSSDTTDITQYVNDAAAANAVPILVAYDLPGRDCGGYSSGGAGTDSAYRSWIRSFAAAIGSHRAAVVLEPDALPELGCFSPARQRSVLALLRYAVGVVGALPRSVIYIDAGNDQWQPASVMAARLRAAGVAHARGFSLNVSNFLYTADETAYGPSISRLLGGKPFVIDTSRNGVGPTADHQWCNPTGRGLGHAPSTRTGVRRLDAYLWIKAPGESDGTCNGGPDAGVWWPNYAVGLAQRAKLSG